MAWPPTTHQDVQDEITAIRAAWTSYTPTWTVLSGTDPSIGNGTLTGRFKQRVDKSVTGTITLSAGTTTTLGSGTYLFSLPVAARNAAEVTMIGLQSSPGHTLTGRGESTTQIRFNLNSNDTVYNHTTSGITSTTTLQITFTYEAA